MAETNETSLSFCRFLDDGYVDLLHAKFCEAFADYVVPFQVSASQFLNHIVLNAVDLSSSVGYFVNEEMVGFTLNGLGDWQGIPTVYDAGTGVVPAYRRRGISEKMFDMMFPVFKARGIEQSLLEVVTTNDPAIQLYEKLGFRKTRTLLLLEADPAPRPTRETPSDVVIREMDDIEGLLSQRSWDGTPSWQNSPEAILRSRKIKRVFGAFIDRECVGYVVFSVRFGRIAQLAVAREFRERGVGTALLAAMEAETDPGACPQVINIDSQLTGAVDFFRRMGFHQKLAQFEMIKPL